jgi:hypothetical protein
MHYEFPQPTPMIMVLGTHFTRASDVIVPDYLTRTDDEYAALLKKSGFELTKVTRRALSDCHSHVSFGVICGRCQAVQVRPLRFR